MKTRRPADLGFLAEACRLSGTEGGDLEFLIQLGGISQDLGTDGFGLRVIGNEVEIGFVAADIMANRPMLEVRSLLR